MARRGTAVSVEPRSIMLGGKALPYIQPVGLSISGGVIREGFIADRIVMILGRGDKKWRSMLMAWRECPPDEVAAMVTHRFKVADLGHACGLFGHERGGALKMAFAS
jgi:hypothetical protein